MSFKRFVKVSLTRLLVSIPFVALSIWFGASALFMEYSQAQIEHESELISELLTYKPLDDASPKQLEELENAVYHTEIGELWVAWFVLEGHQVIHQGPEASNQTLRKAMNRLNGQELMSFLDALGDRMPDQDRSHLKSDFMKRIPPALDFTDEEVAAIRSCQKKLSDQYGRSSADLTLTQKFNIIAYYSSSSVWPPACNLRDAIKISS